MGSIDELPRAEFGFPGPLRDTLVAAILAGKKTSTTSTLLEYGVDNEPLPEVDAQYALVDSAEQAVAVLQVTAVQQVRLVDVPWEHVCDEGEDYLSVAEWRSSHENYWHGSDMRSFLNDPTFIVDDNTRVVLERFRVLRDL